MNNSLAIAVVLLFSLVLVGCDGGHWSDNSNNIPSSFTSNGERIYFTGKSESGSQVKAYGTGGHSNMHRQMHGGGCAACHGADRQGMRQFPVFWKTTPALTPEALFGAEDHSDSGTSDHAHDSYTEESLRIAITEGINPAGKPLGKEMPRWEMDKQDLDGLISYLQK